MSRVIVLDTSVFISALLGPKGASREVLRGCLTGRFQSLMGAALFMEYESVLGRDAMFKRCVLTKNGRESLFDAFLHTCSWTKVYYGWRPNLPDDSDNHLVELAVAGGAEVIVTHNIKNFNRADLTFPDLQVVTPRVLLKEEK